ncbi:MAG: 1,4-alpha-glucan branching enzyme GlgB [Chlamydiae bacterium]|nr:1,4-alpha-glucan branching enzyme GlgB [Chlamydiota bacterium]
MSNIIDTSYLNSNNSWMSLPPCKEFSSQDAGIHSPNIGENQFLKKQIDNHKNGLIKNTIYRVVLIIIRFAIKIFNTKISWINKKLDTHNHSMRGIEFCKRIIQITTLDPSVSNQEEMTVIHLHSTVEEGEFIYKMLENRQTQDLLNRANKALKNGCKAEFFQVFDKLPKSYKQAIYALIELQNSKDVFGGNLAIRYLKQNPEFLLGCKNDQGSNIIEQSIHVYQELEKAQKRLVFGIAAHRKNATNYTTRGAEEEYMYKLEKIFTNLASERTAQGIFSCSIDRIQTDQARKTDEHPLDITMIGVEYSGLLKEGGLAEAIEGLATALAKEGKNKVRLLFPKYSTLPKEVVENLEKCEKLYLDSNQKPIDVYTTRIDGVEILLIDHPTFQLNGDKVSIYDSEEGIAKLRWATFSNLAADVVCQLPTDKERKQIIHLHDCHVAGVAFKLKSEYGEKWKNGIIPPIIFTFHNNSRSAQVRHTTSPYNYSPAIKSLQNCNMVQYINGNPFIELLDFVDASTTVSNAFAEESQHPSRGEGVSFAIRNAAKIGKLFGVINGVNTSRWDPETDSTLKDWKDIESGKRLDLSFGADSTSIIDKKNQAKLQLEKWIKRYLPYGRTIKEDRSNQPKSFNFDPNKPIVTYMGRFDSYQKGMDKLEEAIDSTLKNGGQFILMGSLEDSKSTIILDKLEKKYQNGVLFIRDYKDKKGRYFFQQGDPSQNRPGIGSVIRAASNFTFIPSRFEPCGLIQFEGWLFGSLAIGSKTGGLAETIITSDKNSKSFNGYLFKRDGLQQMSASQIISKALKEMSNLSRVELEAIVKRVMKDAKKYGWNDSPTGLAPARKYEMIYQQAIQSVSSGSRIKEKPVDLTQYYHKKEADFTDSSPKEVLREEAYLKTLYMGNSNSEELEYVYNTFNRGLSNQLPRPYGKGVQYDLHHRFGSHLTPTGAEFKVYAPHATTVLVELYDDKKNYIRTTELCKNKNGVWAVSLNEAKEGYKYRYIINGVHKLDPFGQFTTESRENEPPLSILIKESSYKWKDANWISQRIKNKNTSLPISIYEIHPTTWMKEKDGKPLNYRKLSKKLIEHCKKEGFTHVELMGILEHPCESSMGYQVTGLFSPNSRLGTPDDFKAMVDELHRNSIGVILDWVPAHFANDQFGLANFDGQKLFSRGGLASFFSKQKFWEWMWGTKMFDYGKSFVREFLISSAMYWAKEMHIDMLRVDAVRCIFESQNKNFSKLFMSDLNAIIHREADGVLTIAEDYSGNRGTSLPLDVGGLGFDMVWNVGWMKHVLEFFSTDPKNRKTKCDLLKKAITANHQHSNVLALSHDQQVEVLHLLSSENAKENRNIDYKELLSFMFTVPGKKLMFMGIEFGNDLEWKKQIGKKRGLLDILQKGNQNHQQILSLVHDLNKIYKEQAPLYEADKSSNDIEWINANSPIAFRRKSEKDGAISCLFNLVGEEPIEYNIYSENFINPTIIFNSDNQKYGGKGTSVKLKKIYKNGDIERVIGYNITVPPHSTILIKENIALKTVRKGGIKC